jgi:hypothetical protein
MRHLGWDDQNFSATHDDFLILNLELQGTLEHVSDLFVVVAMERNNTTGAEDDSGQHAALAVDELPIEQWIYMLGGKVFETDVLKGRGVLRWFSHISSFSTRVQVTTHRVSLMITTEHVPVNGFAGSLGENFSPQPSAK